MADLPTDRDSDDAPTPRWVKLLGIAAVLFVVVFAVMHLLGGGLGHHQHGDHTPPQHDDHTPPQHDDHTPPQHGADHP
jgi:hypothetical protein